MLVKRRCRCLTLDKLVKYVPNMDVSDKINNIYRTNQVGSNIVIRFFVERSLKKKHAS